MKRMMIVLAAAALTLTSAAAAETAYPTIALNSADYGIGSVYMADSMLTTETVNPTTVAPYTEEELTALKAGDSIELSDGMVLALSVNDTDTVFEYSSEEASAILSHADALKLNAENGEVTTLEGEVVVARGAGYVAIALDNADYGIGSVYFAADYFTTDHVNPMTVAAYTEEEIAAVKATDAIVMPSDAVIGLSVYGTDTVYFYGAEDAAAILAHADALKLNAENGEVTTLEGEVVVAADAE